MAKELIPVVDIASNLGKRKQHIFKVLKRLGIESTKRKAGNHGQKMAFVTVEEYEQVKEAMASIGDDSDSLLVQPESSGVFYLIQLEPEHDPGRFKVGFATNMDERLRSHKTAAPYSKLLKTWPCKLLWEKTAIDCVCQGCERLHTEVFRTDSIETVKSRCDNFFIQMPELT